jgi:hypothetical protein
MKREIAHYVAECDTCQQVKASHLKVAGTLQPLPIPSWKWEDVSIDFIVVLPNTSQKHDSIWVIVDRLTKIAYFIPVHTSFNAKRYVRYIWIKFFVYTVYQRQSFPIVALSS